MVYLTIILLIISIIVMSFSNEISHFIKKILVDKKTYESIKKDINYFREIIQEYSTGELSLIDGYNINYPRDVIAILLKLKLNKVININENNITINESYVFKLKRSEEYIVSHIKDGKVIIPDAIYFNEVVAKEAKNDDLITNLKVNENKMVTILALTMASHTILIFLNFNPVFLTISFFVIFMATFVVQAFLNNRSKYSWILTEKGEEIFIKLNGLKKYLSEFSVIDKRKIEELLLWDDYLIYSVIFNTNKEIIKKYSKYIIIQKKRQFY